MSRVTRSTARPFPIFVDGPALPKHKGVRSVSSTYPCRGAVAPEEKENVHPTTGTHVSSSSKPKAKSTDTQGKSAKAAVSSSLSARPGLSNSSHNVLPSKASKKKSGVDFAFPSGVATAPTKTRSCSGPAVLTRLSEKSKREMRDSEMASRMNEAQVDSRVKELTILPLADVSEAYEMTPKLDHVGKPRLNEVQCADISAPSTSVAGRRKRASGGSSGTPLKRSPTPSPVKRRRMSLRSDGPVPLVLSES
ncbi:hypothetical protein BOTBODRAFT_56120 [Botryobasidium botryosum FD-172 SS1]|uniref:Uncharacterized protein n=1 Tax=Botryobasidium botryosum (strain FD-172 SS1) TaxID=930990 RepID=A0A067MN43_BOTB1|nr:hypothetical protein BOTBODRAFT_56120 [Botryobasidium botryosum FD-172 SS1]